MAKKNATPEGTRKKKKQTQFSQIMGRLRKNKVAMGGLIVLIIIILAAIFAPLVAPYDPNYMDYSALNQTPSAAHIMGCDNLGRDIFSRIILSLPRSDLRDHRNVFRCIFWNNGWLLRRTGGQHRHANL